jgi:hypothetical protein
MTSSSLVNWMLDTDPALAWQVQRDLIGTPESEWQATRARVATEGMGARMLAHQGADGQWAGGAYFPAEQDGWQDEDGQPWTATTWSLNQLREWGLDAAALAGTAEKLAANARWEYDDLPYWGGEVDVCINAFTLMNGVWLGADVGGLADWFPAHQLSEGGWNCEWVEGETRSSVHSTLNAVRGLLHYERAIGGDDALRAVRKRGEEYLLGRRLMYARSGEVLGGWTTRLSYPLRWACDVLRSTDYFREVALYDGVAPDERISDAIDVIRSKRQPDGRWLQERVWPGRVWFALDVPEGEPSPWVTFYATRVLEWWDAATG